MKGMIKNLPIIGPALQKVWRTWIKPLRHFPGSSEYWERRYDRGGNSGAGSYNRLAEFKAGVLNGLVADKNIQTVIEFGCGDGNQLSLAEYPSYLGFDVSARAIARCKNLYTGDNSKSFRMMSEYRGEAAEMSLSLDVIYHLIEDEVFDDYMQRLFDSAQRLVVIYSSDTDDNPTVQAAHVRHRQFSRWISENRPSWHLTGHVPNKYPFDPDDPHATSFADFYVFEPGSAKASAQFETA